MADAIQQPRFLSLDDNLNALHGVEPSPTYNRGNCRVYLDGVERQDCVTADAERGYVDVHDISTCKGWTPGTMRLHRLFGAVRLEFAA